MNHFSWLYNYVYIMGKFEPLLYYLEYICHWKFCQDSWWKFNRILLPILLYQIKIPFCSVSLSSWSLSSLSQLPFLVTYWQFSPQIPLCFLLILYLLDFILLAAFLIHWREIETVAHLHLKGFTWSHHQYIFTKQ